MSRSNLQINLSDDGVRQKAWEDAARKAGYGSKSQWAARVLEDALAKAVRNKLPPMPGMGRPRKS